MKIRNVVGTVFSTVLRVGIVVFVLYELYKFVFIAYDFGYNVFADTPLALSPGRDITVTITETMGAKDIAQEFEKDHLVKDWKTFYVQEIFSEYKETVTPGVYVLNNSMTSAQIMEVIGGTTEDESATSKKIENTEKDVNNVVINEAGTADESDTLPSEQDGTSEDATSLDLTTSVGATN